MITILNESIEYDYALTFNGDIIDFDTNKDKQIKKLKKMINKIDKPGWGIPESITVGGISIPFDLDECYVSQVPVDGDDYNFTKEVVVCTATDLGYK